MKKEIENLKSAKTPDESQTVKDLKKQIEDLEGEIKTLKENGGGADEAEIRKQIEAEYEVKFYREQQLNKNRSKILDFNAHV